jgi:hypothetical protein
VSLLEDGVSSINAFTSIATEKDSRISSLETDHLAHPTISSFPPPPRAEFSTISEFSSKRAPRPRPRPIFNRAGVDPAANPSAGDPVLPRTPTSDHMVQPKIAANSDPIAITNTTNVIASAWENFSQDIAERAKMRTRKAAKRSTQYAQDVIEITDDDFTISPAKKPKERPKPRSVKRASPATNNPQPPSDPVTIPVPSSSPLLPPSDPFPASTVISPSPPRPHAFDEANVPSSSHKGSPVDRRKRKRPDRLQSPTDDLADLNRFPIAQAKIASHPSNPPPPPARGSDCASGVDLDENLDENEDSEDEYVIKKSCMKPKSSKATERSGDIANTRPERRRTGKSRNKTVVEVVVMSPRKKARKGVQASKKDSSDLGDDVPESRNDRLVVSSLPAERLARPVEGEDAYQSPQQTSDSDDELILAQKRKPLVKTKSRKGKREAQEQTEDNGSLAEIEPSREPAAADGEEREGSRTDQRETEHASTSPARDHRTSRFRHEPKTPVPLKVRLAVSFVVSITDST